jgi:DNA-binding XRE family transcriptional regulator
VVGFKTIIDIENGKAKALNEKSIKLKAVLAQSFKIVQLIIN